MNDKNAKKQKRYRQKQKSLALEIKYALDELRNETIKLKQQLGSEAGPIPGKRRPNKKRRIK